ncbi:hypothetical protein A9C11_20975 [Pseudomonas citronellolis]|uniref:Uncharacterized protein n=1 Tax=Pseudomonas citronellolis TaxID=53408 RepID=A0A1A9KFH7_9PSED|nr:hypothetical protein A9C11_20975 [Pseudomonas citronellolis]KSE81060.1 hypothetical protein AO924_20115 [Pseudomonas aeruginosa]KSN11640.1 hypothetical protein APA79_00780 [Pseudomonas aeruginosa]
MRSAWSNDSSVIKERFRELARNASQIVMLFVHSNLWMAHRSLRPAQKGAPVVRMMMVTECSRRLKHQDERLIGLLLIAFKIGRR